MELMSPHMYTYVVVHISASSDAIYSIGMAALSLLCVCSEPHTQVMLSLLLLGQS